MGKIFSYITGSRAYGIPRDDSDVDLVVACFHEDYEILKAHSEAENKVHFGKLNLVLFNLDDPKSRARYKGWRQVHDKLVMMKPVTRDFAIKCFEAAGVTGGDSGE